MVAKRLPPASEVVEEPYLYRLLKAPALQGWSLAAFARIYETNTLGSVIYNQIAPQSGVKQVLHDVIVPEAPLFLPLCPVNEVGDESGCATLTGTGLAAVTGLQEFAPDLATTATGAATASSAPAANTADAGQHPYRRPTVADYVSAYRSGATTPTQVAERIIAFIKASQQSGYGWFINTSPDDILTQAKESTERWQTGKPRSCLDGVPYAVKDFIDAEPYPTTVGTSFAADRFPASGNAPYITALRQAGAILLGKTTLHEIGLGITGLNVRTGTALNPYNTGHFTGGSSSGSGAVVAAGLCPIAIGTDGGGSIRIPSSFCGVYGLKTTNARVSRKGGFQVDHTVAAKGPMAASVQDAAVLYSVMANLDVPSTHVGEALPPIRLPKPLKPYGEQPLSGGKAGVYWEWFRDADPEVVSACEKAVEVIQGLGCQVSKVCIPELELLRVAHNVTIVSEMLETFQDFFKDPSQRALFNLDVRIALDSARFWTACDYLQSQRIRRRAHIHFKRVMQDVDVLLVPSVPCTAPAIPAGALKGGCSNLEQTSKVMRFSVPANMLGLPAFSIPVGCDSQGLPIGLQIIAKPWHEATLIRYAAALERALDAQRSQGVGVPVAGVPKVWIDPLTGACRPPA